MPHEPINVANLIDLDVDPSLEWNPAYVPPILPKRSSFFSSGSGYLVTHPSTGGIVMMSPSAVDLAYLELPRTHDTTRSTPDVEDDLAVRMLGLGATWWPNWVTYSRHKARIDDDVIYDFHFPPKTYVGYPSTGGVWVMQFSPDQNWFDSLGQYGKQRTWPEMPLDFHVRMGMVLNNHTPTNTSPDDGLEICACDPPFSPLYTPPRPPLRSNIFPGPGFLVAYPSRGGLVLMHPSPLNLQHLDLPRTHDTPRSSLPAVEDGLADRMLRLGAHWWPSWTLYAQHADRLSSGTVYDFHFPPDVGQRRGIG
ncbi:hypothetical protein Brms1b_012045 [Colletotrichum noveboracense]|nr:hypothetical protein Brms1b_012045 [Colletotrichum noveboracense]